MLNKLVTRDIKDSAQLLPKTDLCLGIFALYLGHYLAPFFFGENIGHAFKLIMAAEAATTI